MSSEPVGSEAEDARARWISATQIAGLASIAAGAIHAAAAGGHAEQASLSRLFVATAVAQLVVGLVLLVRGGRIAAAAAIAINGGAVGAWLLTRISGISWIDGLERAESPAFADSVCAVLGTVAVAGAIVVVARGSSASSRARLGLPAVAIGAITVVAMMSGATNVHSHDDTAEHGHDDTAGATAVAGAGAADHAHPDEAAPTTEHAHATEDQAEAAASAWPRPWDPAAPIDFSGVPGVTVEQQARAEGLAASTIAELPQFADVSTLAAAGFLSIGDAATGFEHFINPWFIGDDHFLDPTRPESLVYAVNGEQRTLVSAMFMANDLAVDDPELVDWGGPLMQWHVHENLCFGLGEDGKPKVVGLTDEADTCPPGSVNAGGDIPMVHVWITAHECGPFAALEGHGAGQVATTGARTDQCAHDHEATAAEQPATAAYDPTKPIDLSGVEGVTPEQQAYAENLVAVTLVRLPQWSDPAVAEAAGFHSIGDAATGHEHYVQWNWIDDDVWLDPDAPESLVYEPQPDGTKKLVSAMYMLPRSVALTDVPDFGGRLMQWHIHDDLCFTDDPVAPQVRGLTRADGTCQPPLVAHDPAPMIHVWITPHECGPFASLEGVAAGSIVEGQERWCDHAHGS